MAELKPIDSTIYRASRQMGRAVAKGYLTPAQRYAALVVASYGAEKRGQLEGAAPGVVRCALHFSAQEAEAVASRRVVTEYRVAQVSRRLIEINAPTGRIWAESHNENGAAGFPLTEQEVEAVVKAEAAKIIRSRQWQAKQGLRRA